MGVKQANEIWVLGDRRTEAIFGLSLRALGAARELGQGLGAKAAMVLLGAGTPADGMVAPQALGMEAAAERSVAHGADVVYLCDHPDLTAPLADRFARALALVFVDCEPRYMLFPLTDFSRETAARTSALTGTGLIADCVGLRVGGRGVVAQCPAWGGTVMSEIGFAEGVDMGFITVDPYAWGECEERGDPGRREILPLGGLALEPGCALLRVCAQEKTGRQLEEADVVVVGGAGLGNIEQFGLVRELAAALGGEVGATRPPVLSHWVDEDRLIGQTGKRVRPRLLVSVGTSGAVQYTAGISEAGTIVAVNRDPAAPIFETADIGVVADAKGFLPLLTEAVKQLTLRHMADALAENGDAPQGGGFGERLGRLRKSQGWSLEALAEATGESPEFIRQVEDGTLTPPVGFLLRFANALKVDPGTFLRQEEKTLLRDLRAQAFVKRTQNYSYETLSPGAENDHLRAFLVTIESRQAHRPVAYKHEGEEFIFVMEGELALTLGTRSHHLKPGESMHFNSDMPHKLKSVSNEPTRCLVVLYTP